MGVVTGQGTLTSSFSQAVTSGLVTTQSLPASITLTTQYQASGTAANQVDLVYAKQLTLSAAATTLDLTSITALDGTSVTFARVREFVVQVVDATAGHSVSVQQGSSNGFAPLGTNTVFPSGVFYFRDAASVGSGVGAVVTSTSKTVKLDPGANTVVVNVLIAGCSAVS